MSVSWSELREAYSPRSIDNLWAQNPLIERVTNRLRENPPVTILGTSHSGRDSVLRLIQQRLDPCVICSVSQHADAADIGEFWREIANGLISQLKRGGVESILSYEFPRDVHWFFQDLTEGTTLYILLDDLSELRGQIWEQSALEAFQSLAGISNLHIAFAGSVYPSGENLREDFPFSKLTAPIYLGKQVSTSTLEQYIRQAKGYGIEYATRMIEAIVELTGREPVLVQRLCAVVFGLLEKQQKHRVTEDKLAAARFELIDQSGNDLFLPQWRSLTFVEQMVLITVRALGQEFGETVSPEEIRDRLQALVETPNVGLDVDPSSALELLERRLILKEKNWRYTFANALFSDWIPQVPDPRDLLPALCKGFAALARSASYPSEMESRLVEASLPIEKHSKGKFMEDLYLMTRGEPLTLHPVILHISDTQFGEEHAFLVDPTDHRSLCATLADDIESNYEHEGIPLPNFLVISGDIANSAMLDEYEAAEDFVEELCNRLGIDRRRLIIVPGNHDVNFQISYGVFHKFNRETERFEPTEDWDDSPAYQARMYPFKSFFDQIYIGKNYDLSRRGEQSAYTIYDFVDRFGLLVVGFNSCARVDHKSNIGKICTVDIHDAEREIKQRFSEESIRYKVAVWHHSVTPGDPSGADYVTNWQDVKELVFDRFGYHLVLHGHIHRLEAQVEQAAGGLGWCLGAGSVGVPEPQRPGDSGRGHFPFSYNIIELGADNDSRRVRVHTRMGYSDDRERTHWQPYRWPRTRRDWCAFHLPAPG